MLTLKLATLLFSLQPVVHASVLPLEQNPAPGSYVNEEGGPLLPLLQNAKKKIDIEIYTMGDVKVRALLRAALKRGVKVRIVKDPNPLGGKCDIFGATADVTDTTDNSAADCADQQKLVSDVRAAGGEYIPFDKQALCPNGGGKGGTGCFEHGKIALVDDLALLSSGNFDSTNLCISSENPRICDRDYSLVIDDREVINTLQNIFNADLAGARYDVKSLIPSGLASTLTVSPISLQPIVDFIDTARNALVVETQYLKDPTMNEAIIRAAKRGVKVSVTVASACAFGKPSSSEAKEIQSVYSAFDSAGISSRMFSASSPVNGHAGYIHAKLIVVDGARAWVGSENGSTESLTQNREYGLIFDKADDVRTVLDTAEADHVSQGAETWSESLTCTKDKASSDPAPTLLPQKSPPKKK